jgi:C4-type Zn-finger protein
MAAKMVEPNKWHLAVDCAECQEPIPFLEAPSPVEEPHVKQRTISDLKCPNCGYTDTYAPALMTRLQGPEN